MKLWEVLRSFNIKQLWSLSKLCLRNPLKMWPSWKATKKSVAYATTYYGKLHQQNNPANAFRHAVWNFLIARNCMKDPSELADVLIWTDKITALHEDLFPNDPLARAMDLHNNEVGRMLFKKHHSKTEEEAVQLMRSMTKTSRMISDLKEIEYTPTDQYVHITNMPDYEG